MRVRLDHWIDRVSERTAAALLLAVPMSLFALMYLLPLVYSIYISFFNFGLFGAEEFVGLGNYEWIFQDPYLWKSIRNTVIYAAVVVPAQMALGLGLALIVHRNFRGRAFFRSAFYFPAIASSAVLTMIFMLLFAPGDAGAINSVLGALGLPQPNWLADSDTALPTIMILNAWTAASGAMLFYLAALQAIPEDLYSAASIDGATRWAKFRHITLPMLAPAHLFVGIMATIGAFKVFDQAFIVSGGTGGPNYSTMTLALYIYRMAFGNLSFGYAAAIGVVMFLVIAGLTMTQRKTLFSGSFSS